MSSSPIHIAADPDDGSAWLCICGNRESTGGFETCDRNGNPVVPTIESTWVGFYLCTQCRRIIKHPTRQVVGIKPLLPRFRVQFTEQTAYELWVEAANPLAAARKVAQQFSDEGPENMQDVSNTTCDWLVFDADGVVSDIDESELLEEDALAG